MVATTPSLRPLAVKKNAGNAGNARVRGNEAIQKKREKRFQQIQQNNSYAVKPFEISEKSWKRSYQNRKDEQCTNYQLDIRLQDYIYEFIDVDYDVEKWYERTKGLEYDPERGQRCTECFDMRIERTALYAFENGFQAIATKN